MVTTICIKRASDWIEEIGSWGIAAKVALLWATAAVVVGMVAPVAALSSGSAGLAAVGAAALACLAGATIAMVATHVLSGPVWALHGLLVGILVRMTIPLALATGCLVGFPALVSGGLLYYLLVFYPVTLTVETWLSISRRTQTSVGAEKIEPAAN